MAYQFPCICDAPVEAEIWQCGAWVRCAACGASVKVPDSVTLKELAGDRHPYLTTMEKIRVSAAKCEEPFQGKCHGCRTVDAMSQTPVLLEVMTERILDHDGRIQPHPFGVKLVASSGTELWESVTFPLLLCGSCLSDFEAARRRLTLRRYLKHVLLLALFAAFLALAYFHSEAIAALSSVFAVVGAVAWIILQRRKSRVERAMKLWLDRIRWVPDLINSEDEFRLRFGNTRGYDRCEASREATIDSELASQRERRISSREFPL